MTLIIDPPSGWKYGFPKPIPEDRRYDSVTWLVEQGYPQELIDELGGLNNDAARRELLCEIIKDSKTSVIPEFDTALEKEIVIHI